MIELLDIHKSFGEKQVLKGLTLSVIKGETLVVLGRSGCGKSVLLKLILGLMRQDSGKIIIDGRDTSQISEERMTEVRKKFGMLFQGGALFDSLTVAENVAYPLREHTKLKSTDVKRKVAEKLALVEMEGTEDLMPSNLSGGMKKRVALARALALEPEYILYDEPTTGLDPITAERINRLIRRMQTKFGVTSVVVTHEIRNAYMVADRLAMIHEGRILTSGTVEELKRTEIPFVREFISNQAGK